MIDFYVSSPLLSAVSIFGEGFSVSGTSNGEFVLPIDDVDFFGDKAAFEIIVSVMPADDTPYLFPRTLVIKAVFKDEIVLLLRDKSDNARLISWGKGVFELVLDGFAEYRPPLSTAKLDSAEISTNTGRKTLTLYRDCGVRLETASAGNEHTYTLGFGNDGRIRTVDVGSTQIIVITVFDYFDGNSNALSSAKRQKAFILDTEFRVLSEIIADSFYIENGNLYAIEELNTVLGHESRRRYALGEIFEKASPNDASSSTEIGYFTHKRRRLNDPKSVAVALLECILLDRRDECIGLLSDELKNEVGYDDLCAYFGDFDDVLPAPWQDKKEGVTVGILCGDHATPYRFMVENGNISEVMELDS